MSSRIYRQLDQETLDQNIFSNYHPYSKYDLFDERLYRKDQGGPMKHLNTRIAMLICAVALGYVDFKFWWEIFEFFTTKSSPNGDMTAAAGMAILFLLIFSPVIVLGFTLLCLMTYWFFVCCYFFIFPEKMELKEPKELI